MPSYGLSQLSSGTLVFLLTHFSQYLVYYRELPPPLFLRFYLSNSTKFGLGVQNLNVYEMSK